MDIENTRLPQLSPIRQISRLNSMSQVETAENSPSQLKMNPTLMQIVNQNAQQILMPSSEHHLLPT